MKKHLFACLALALGVLPGGPSAQSGSRAADAATLWERASRAWSMGESWKPSRMSIRFDELDGRGAVKSTTLTEYALSYPGGEPSSTVLRSFKDGKDVTAEARAEQARREAKGRDGEDGRMDAEDIVPFASRIAASVRRGEPAPAPGGLSVPYRVDKPKGGSTGTVWFDAAGWPVRLEYTLEPLPAMVSSMSGEVSFIRLPDDSLAVSSLGFRGEGGVLFVRMRFAVKMEFSGYSRR